MSILSIIDFILVMFLLYSFKNAIVPYLAQSEFPYKDKDGKEQMYPAQPPNYGMILGIGIVGLLFIIATVAGGIVCWNVGPKIVG